MTFVYINWVFWGSGAYIVCSLCSKFFQLPTCTSIDLLQSSHLLSVKHCTLSNRLLKVTCNRLLVHSFIGHHIFVARQLIFTSDLCCSSWHVSEQPRCIGEITNFLFDIKVTYIYRFYGFLFWMGGKLVCGLGRIVLCLACYYRQQSFCHWKLFSINHRLLHPWFSDPFLHHRSTPWGNSFNRSES